MDKFEYELKVEQIEKLIHRGDTITAKKIADGMEWKKEKDTKLLRKVAELYVETAEYEQALYLLRLAYNASPRGIMILERMIELALDSENLELAEEFCEAYEKVSPDSSELALFKYRLATEKKAPASELIKWLKKYTTKEMDEEYSYRLAELYEEIGDRAACIKQCDYIIDFFCFGEFVDKAADLKEKFAELDSYQLRRMSKRNEYEQEYNSYIEENDYKQKRQAREDAAEKQIIEAQLMEQHAAKLGSQISEIVEENERKKEEINLDSLVMDEILQAENSMKNAKTSDGEVAGDEELDLKGLVSEFDDVEEDKRARKVVSGFETKKDADEDDAFEFEKEEAAGGGFWAGIKSKLKKNIKTVDEDKSSDWDNFDFEAKPEDEKPENEDVVFTAEETEKPVNEYNDIAKEELEESVEELVEEEAEELAEELAEEPVEEPVEEQAEELIEESAEELIEEQPEETVAAEKTEAEKAIDGFIKSITPVFGEEPILEENNQEDEEFAEDETEPDTSDDDFEDDEEFDEKEEKKPFFKRSLKKKDKEEADSEAEAEDEDNGLEPPEGNFMVACMSMDDGKKYAIEMIRRMDKDIRFESIAALTGRSFNKAKFSQLKNDFNQDIMLITGAGELTPSSADNLLRWMLEDEDNCVALVDSSQHLADLEHRSPKLMKQFRKQYDYQAMSSEDWISMIEKLAKSENVVLDDSAYELFEKYLQERSDRGEVVVGQDLEDALFEAIHRAERFSIGGILSGILATKYDEDGMLIVKEKHFA